MVTMTHQDNNNHPPCQQDLPECDKTYLPYLPPKIILLNNLMIEGQVGSGADAGGYFGHHLS